MFCHPNHNRKFVEISYYLYKSYSGRNVLRQNGIMLSRRFATGGEYCKVGIIFISLYVKVSPFGMWKYTNLNYVYQIYQIYLIYWIFWYIRCTAYSDILYILIHCVNRDVLWILANEFKWMDYGGYLCVFFIENAIHSLMCLLLWVKKTYGI